MTTRTNPSQNHRHAPEIVAFHEAAHAVVGEALGKRLRYLELANKGSTHGETCMEWFEPRPNDFLEREFAICMAGPLMDRLLTGDSDAQDADWVKIRFGISLLTANDDDKYELRDRVQRRALEIIVARLDKIGRIANIILSHGANGRRLSREQLLHYGGSDLLDEHNRAAKP